MRTGKEAANVPLAADSRSPRNGRFIEILGTYEPRHDPSVIKFDNDRAVHWLRHGAQPTETVEKLLRISGAWEQFTGKPLEPVVYPEKKSAPLEASEEPAAEEASEEPAAEEASEEPAAEELLPRKRLRSLQLRKLLLRKR